MAGASALAVSAAKIKMTGHLAAMVMMTALKVHTVVVVREPIVDEDSPIMDDFVDDTKASFHSDMPDVCTDTKSHPLLGVDDKNNKDEVFVVTPAVDDSAEMTKKEEDTSSLANQKKPSAKKGSNQPAHRKQNWHRMHLSAREEFNVNTFSEVRAGTKLCGWLIQAMHQIEGCDNQSTHGLLAKH